MKVGLMIECPTAIVPGVVETLRSIGFERDACYGIPWMPGGHSLMRGICGLELVPKVQQIPGVQVWADLSIQPTEE